MNERTEHGKSALVNIIFNLANRFPFLLSLLAGAVSATGFAPLNFWPLTLFALALWIAILMGSESKKAAFFSSWLFGLGHFVIGLNWIAKAFTFQSALPEWLGYIAILLISSYLAIFPALAGLGAWWLSPKSTLDLNEVDGTTPTSLESDPNRTIVFILALAGFWVITEWLRSWLLSGFSWNPLSTILVNGRWLISRPLEVVGTYGSSAIIIIFSGCLALSIMALRARDKLETIGWLVLPAGMYPIFLVVLLAYNVITTPPVDDDISFEILAQPLITIVQPNIGQQDKWQVGYEEKNLSKLAALTARDDRTPRIIFWPEAAIPDYLEDGYPQRYYFGRPPDFVRRQLAALMKPGDVLVLGALKLEFDEAETRAVGARNSVFAMNNERELLGRYDKSHLLPFGEYLPARSLLSAIGLSRFAPGDFDFWPGDGVGSFEIGDFGNMGLALCYEIIFSGQVVDRENRPDFIFNPSNDAWFGSWGPPQHLAQARLRAIEEGLPVIRSTPTGISAVITANGVVKKSVPLGKAGRIDTVLPLAKRPTLFALYGNILPLGFALILLISAIAIRLRGR